MSCVRPVLEWEIRRRGHSMRLQFTVESHEVGAKPCPGCASPKGLSANWLLPQRLCFRELHWNRQTLVNLRGYSPRRTTHSHRLAFRKKRHVRKSLNWYSSRPRYTKYLAPTALGAAGAAVSKMPGTVAEGPTVTMSCMLSNLGWPETFTLTW